MRSAYAYRTDKTRLQRKRRIKFYTIESSVYVRNESGSDYSVVGDTVYAQFDGNGESTGADTDTIVTKFNEVSLVLLLTFLTRKVS